MNIRVNSKRRKQLTEKSVDSGGTYKISVWRSIVRIIEATSHRLLQGGITLKLSSQKKLARAKYVLVKERRLYSQKWLVFTEVIQSIKHLNNNKHSHRDSWWMPILKDTARISCLPCWTCIKIHLKQIELLGFMIEIFRGCIYMQQKIWRGKAWMYKPTSENHTKIQSLLRNFQRMYWPNFS